MRAVRHSRGDIKHRLHIGFDDPSDAVGTENFITEEFRRVRDEIKDQFLPTIHHPYRLLIEIPTKP